MNTVVEKKVINAFKEIFDIAVFVIDGYKLDFDRFLENNKRLLNTTSKRLQIPFDYFYINEDVLRNIVHKYTKGCHYFYRPTKSDNIWEYLREYDVLDKMYRTKREIERSKEFKVLKKKYSLIRRSPDAEQIRFSVYLGPSPTSSIDIFNRRKQLVDDYLANGTKPDKDKYEHVKDFDVFLDFYNNYYLKENDLCNK